MLLSLAYLTVFDLLQIPHGTFRVDTMLDTGQGLPEPLGWGVEGFGSRIWRKSQLEKIHNLGIQFEQSNIPYLLYIQMCMCYYHGIYTCISGLDLYIQCLESYQFMLTANRLIGVLVNGKFKFHMQEHDYKLFFHNIYRKYNLNHLNLPMQSSMHAVGS